MKQIILKNPKDLLNVRRFDVMFKYMYARSRELNLNTKYFRDAYKHHIQVWNNFKEYDNPKKNSYEAFITTFNEVLDSIKQNGFDENISLVPITKNSILNGAHRYSACLLYDKPVKCYEGVDGRDGSYDCSWYSLNRSVQYGKLNPDHCDRAALEYVNLVKNTYTVILFPSATQSNLAAQTRAEILKHGELLYEKSLFLNKSGAINLMRELYWKEAWAESNGRSGYVQKASLCFTNFEAPTVVFIVQFKNLDDAVKCKEDIRKLYNLGKHSVHINDTYEETNRITKAVFNKNSIHYLNGCDYRKQENVRLEKLTEEYKNLINANNLDIENYCITAGAVIARYGLKECKDLDYIHSTSPVLKSSNPDIQSHNSYGIGLYENHYDDIVHNPENYFYVHGVKHASLDIVKKLKQKRNEPKDLNDIKLIESV